MTYKFFLDTNLWIDFYTSRPPFTEVAKELIESLYEKNHNIFTSTSCLGTLIYFIEKKNTIDQQKNVIKNLNDLSVLIDANEAILRNLMNSKYQDLEDALLYHIAAFHQVDYLVTRNTKDFIREGITQVINLQEALEIIQGEKEV